MTPDELRQLREKHGDFPVERILWQTWEALPSLLDGLDRSQAAESQARLDRRVAQAELQRTDESLFAARRELEELRSAAREFCRDCRNESEHMDRIVPADFILWGKHFPKEAFGPKCTGHASQWFPIYRVDQYAVFDLRPFQANTKDET